MPDLTSLDATTLAPRLARRELTAEALIRECLARIAAREPEVQAFAFLDPELALAQARALDRGAIRGPLHGLPIGVKDIFATADQPTGYGSKVYEGHRPANDAACVALARRAGAVILGKTVTTEFATFPPGKTRNPRNLAHTPGGSSSGSAAGVADGFFPLAFGTQTAGSVVRPAAFCGIVGYKPTYATIARAGAMIGSDTLDTVGTLARTVPDAALLAAAVSRRDDLRVDAAAGAPRIGLCRTHEWDRTQPETQALFETAARTLGARGARVVEIQLPQRFAGMLAAQRTVMGYEGALNHADELNRGPERIQPKLRELCESGFNIAPKDYVAALALARACRAELSGVFGDCDVLLAPSAPGEAPALTLGSTGDPVMNSVWTLLYAPVVNVPAGHGPNGLPLGLSVVGRLHDDARTLTAADWIHRNLA